MIAKFKTKSYECENIRQSTGEDGANILSLLLSGVDSMDGLKEEATGCEQIEISEDGSVTQVFKGYVNYLGLTDGQDTVDVTVSQISLAEQIAVLKHQIAVLNASQDEQDEEITEIQEVLVEEE